MAIGRISGSVLKSNLTRNGVDLAFETNLLYLDVTNSRVGIGTSEPTTALQVAGTIASTGLTVDTNTLHVDSANNRVGIGTTSPDNKLHIQNGDASASSNASSNLTIESNSATNALQFLSPNTASQQIRFGDPQDDGAGFINYSHASSFLSIGVNGPEKMRISSTGDFFVACTVLPSSSVGFGVSPSGQIRATVAADDILTVNRLSNDGQLVLFRQDTITEGNIAVSGATVSYNGFTGTHWSRFQDNSTPTILRGTVLESLDEMCDWYNLEFEVTDEEGNTSTQKVPYVLQDGQSDGDVITYNHEGTDVQATIVKEADVKHVKSKVSDTVDAKNVYGVFIDYDNDGEGYNDFYVASVGSFVVRIKQGETVAKGDLLQSNGDGTAKVQTDDAIRASTFAKVLSTTVIETYEDGSYLVPCSLMC